MNKRVILFALICCASSAFVSCGKKSDGGIAQPQNNPNNSGYAFDPATSTITLDSTTIQISGRSEPLWNTMNGPAQFNGMRNLVRVFRLPSAFTGTLQVGLPMVTYSRCNTPDIRRNVRFTVIQNGTQYFVSNRFYLFGDGSDKFLVVKLEEVDCMTAGIQFVVNRVL